MKADQGEKPVFLIFFIVLILPFHGLLAFGCIISMRKEEMSYRSRLKRLNAWKRRIERMRWRGRKVEG